MRRPLTLLSLAALACARPSAPAVPAPVAATDTLAVPAAPDTMVSYRAPAFATEPLIVWGAPPPGTPHVPRTRVYDLQHQVVRVRFDWRRHAVVGSTTLRIAALEQPLPSISIDAVDMTIGRVAGSTGASLRHEYDGRTLTVHLPSPLAAGARTTFTVDYETVGPKKGAYFIDRRHVVWTQGETEDTRYWVPTYDFPNDKTTWEFHVRVPRGEKALSNGRLAGTRRVGGDTEWHWIQDKPASTYLMAAVTGDYVVLQDTWRRTTPVGYWTYADSVEATWRGMGKTPRMMELFSTTLGIDYPWTKYDQANAPDYIFGGMENVTATIQADDAILHPAWADPHARTEQLVAHELAHQWFGDLVTTRDWANVWLNEGFARFLEQYWMEVEHAPDGGPWHRLQTHEQAIAADRAARRPLVYGVWETDPLEVFFSGHIYPKGAAVLQMLRHQLGDSTFWRAMHRYATKHAYQNVETADFQRAVEEASGRGLTTFFRQWVFGAGVPAFRVSHAYDSVARELRLVATQVQPRDSLTGLFEADVDVEVLTDSGPVRATVAVRGETAEARIPLRAAPRSIRWDKGNWLLDVADFPRPTVMLAHQLAHDDDVAGRIEAMDLLARRHGEVIAARALATAVREERFAPARARALAGLGALALGRPGAPEIAVMPLRAIATAAALHALDDADPRVRQEVPVVIGAVSRQALGEHIGRLLSDSSRYVRGAAIQAYAAAFPTEALDSIRAMLAQESWIDITRRQAVTALGLIRTPEAWTLLLRSLEAGTRRETRQAAIASLLGHAAGREPELASALVPLLDAEDLFIRRDAARALGTLGQGASIAPLEARRRVEAEGRVVSAIDAALAALRGGS